MKKILDEELKKLTDDELLELYKIIEEHRTYLDSSILTIEEETTEEEKEDEPTK